MSKMWKPGTSKPSNRQQEGGSKRSPKQQSPSNGSGPSANGSSSSASKKKLSGSTMGMRFMQRKMEAEAARQEAQREKNQQEKMEWTATAQDNDEEGSSDNEMEESHVPQVATSSDMYGAKSDLIGRRSFGGFRPHVSDTYKSTCTAWEKGKTEDKKEHISDEELLRRYKDYRSGKGDMMDSPAAAPIGNLQEKLKKRGKRKSQSPHKGEKRKR